MDRDNERWDDGKTERQRDHGGQQSTRLEVALSLTPELRAFITAQFKGINDKLDRLGDQGLTQGTIDALAKKLKASSDKVQAKTDASQ